MLDAFFVPKESQFTVRLLGGKPFFFAARLHMLSRTSTPSKFFCHKELVDGKWVGNCVACKHYSDFYQNGPPRLYQGSQSDFENDVRTIKPVERYYYNAIVRTQEELGPKIWSIGKMLHQTILSAILGETGSATFMRPLGDVSHPISGHDFFVKVSQQEAGGMMIPKYEGQFMPASSLGTHEQIEEWLDNRHDLSKCRNLKPEAEMLAALETVFGYLGAPRNRKKIYRSITDPFQPEW